MFSRFQLSPLMPLIIAITPLFRYFRHASHADYADTPPLIMPPLFSAFIFITLMPRHFRFSRWYFRFIDAMVDFLFTLISHWCHYCCAIFCHFRLIFHAAMIDDYAIIDIFAIFHFTPRRAPPVFQRHFPAADTPLRFRHWAPMPPAFAVIAPPPPATDATFSLRRRIRRAPIFSRSPMPPPCCRPPPPAPLRHYDATPIRHAFAGQRHYAYFADAAADAAHAAMPTRYFMPRAATSRWDAIAAADSRFSRSAVLRDILILLFIFYAITLSLIASACFFYISLIILILAIFSRHEPFHFIDFRFRRRLWLSMPYFIFIFFAISRHFHFRHDAFSIFHISFAIFSSLRLIFLQPLHFRRLWY